MAKPPQNMIDIFCDNTEHLRPSIRRYPDGDVCICWPRPVSIKALAGLCDLDETMFTCSTRYAELYVPVDVANYQPMAQHRGK